ncbi:unnamed protein product [Adineta ricciae]|uniref:Uncharacterized protein n=1 Tax=Adineta ricciae TaxID=249248 RepID=A0A814FXZ3_ADIRI|nr:unnamed protein product [Adineta ricciae]CAF1349374.1 unnamed protein product [Adineta ricciae]
MNFSFHIDDKDIDLYYFESGPVATIGQNSSVFYMPMQCGTAFERLFLLSFDLKTKTYQQSHWISHNGFFHYLFYDPLRQRLFGLYSVSTFTLIIEEYDLHTLEAIKQYTKQDGEQYAFSYANCYIFDYEENWIVEVRTRFENPSVEAYYIKMDLNLVGKKGDIVVDFHHMPEVHNLCSMTYDMKTKNVFATWQHGSIDQDLIMLYMNPYTGEFRNETLLFPTPAGLVVQDIQAVYNETTRQILFFIHHENDSTFSDTYWTLLVEFDTMKILEKKQVKNIQDFDMWELFLL